MGAEPDDATLHAIAQCCQQLNQHHLFAEANIRTIGFLCLNKLLLDQGAPATILEYPKVLDMYATARHHRRDPPGPASLPGLASGLTISAHALLGCHRTPHDPEHIMTQWQSVLLEQQRYYNDRAAEYDDWWFRRGSFDEGDAANNRWCEEAAHVQEALDAAALQGDILELAAGTGIWSIRLLPTAQTLTLVDGSAQMLKINPATRDQRVRTVQADLFQWQATRTYDAVVFAFWISHVPRQLLPQFLRQVADAAGCGREVLLRRQSSKARSAFAACRGPGRPVDAATPA